MAVTRSQDDVVVAYYNFKKKNQCKAKRHISLS